MQRLLIIGPCGAGKSTLATALGERLGLPVYRLDQLKWQPGWVESSNQDFERKLTSIVVGQRWLIDGNYGGSLHLRLPRADTVIYLDYPIRLCVIRLLRRIWIWCSRTRPDMTEGCPERFDFAFLLYLLKWNLGPRPRTEQRLRGYESKVVRIKSPKALEAWLVELPAS